MNNTTTPTPDTPLTPVAPASPTRRRRKARWLWQGRVFPAFWTITGIISLVVNIILIVTLILVGRELFVAKSLVQGLITGLHSNFVLMDQAHIKTTINVSTTIPVKFTLPVKTNTTVVLTADTTIKGASVSLSTGGLYIQSAPTNIILPAGTNLPIALNISVPVDTTIPVQIPVDVDIPLNNTELHQPFVGLQQVVGPYKDLLNSMPNSWDDILPKPWNDIFSNKSQTNCTP
jgi:hypothetical protein